MSIKNSFIEATLIKVLGFIRDAVFSEEYSLINGALQRLDVRIKCLSLIIILLVVALIKSITLILFLYLMSVLLAWLSKIKPSYFLKRTWFFIPLFSVFIVIPSLFSIFTPGDVIFFSITRQGLMGAILFISRVTTSVSFSILFILTTGHNNILSSLRAFGLPAIFVTVFTMCYRYLYIFIKVIEDTSLGIKARIIANLKERRARNLIAWRIGVIWEKSLVLSEEAYLAMLARGYSGEPKGYRAPKLKAVDFLWLGGLIIFSLAILYIDARALI